jgi:hypothetical protein
MQRLRIIAPLVVSTLYNCLWSDSCSGHFTQLLNHVHHEQQFLASVDHQNLSWNVVCLFWNRALSFPSRDTFSLLRGWFEELSVKPHSLCQALLLQKFSLWRRTLCKNFLAVYPALYPSTHPLQRRRSFSDWYMRVFMKSAAQTQTHSVWTLAGYINTKRDSAPTLYMIKCKYCIGSKPILHFSSVSGPLQGNGLK